MDNLNLAAGSSLQWLARRDKYGGKIRLKPPTLTAVLTYGRGPDPWQLPVDEALDGYERQLQVPKLRTMDFEDYFFLAMKVMKVLNRLHRWQRAFFTKLFWGDSLQTRVVFKG